MSVSLASALPRAAIAAASFPVLGRWELTHCIGSGSFTDVFRARPVGSDLRAPGDYAVKLLRAEMRHERAARGMLQREAFVAGHVNHPHLVAVLEAHCEGAAPLLVTPYYPGATLAAVVRTPTRRPLPLSLWLVRQAAEALAALHEAGWIHGDVQPGNIQVGPGGHVTLLDLGLACRAGSAECDPRARLAGTPAYLPPEAFQTHTAITVAADIYGLGVVLYELIAGARPFEDDDPLALVAAHCEALPPALRKRWPHVPSRLARLVRRMLAKEPLRRPSAGELVAQLAELEIDTFDQR